MSHSPNYLIFAGDAGVARGGWGDFFGVADTTKEARRQIDVLPFNVNWWEIVSIETLKIVEES